VNAGSAVAGIFSPIVFGFVVDHTGSWTLPFAGSVGLLAIGIVMTFFMRPDIALDTGVDHDDKTATHEMTLADRLR
jgi:cyanate permease